jgi:hypothetical protein
VEEGGACEGLVRERLTCLRIDLTPNRQPAPHNVSNMCGCKFDRAASGATADTGARHVVTAPTDAPCITPPPLQQPLAHHQVHHKHARHRDRSTRGCCSIAHTNATLCTCAAASSRLASLLTQHTRARARAAAHNSTAAAAASQPARTCALQGPLRITTHCWLAGWLLLCVVVAPRQRSGRSHTQTHAL